MFNVLKFYKDFGIDFATEGNKHTRKGWVQIHCVFCTGSQNYSLGYNLEDEFFTCWRCRGKSTVEVVRRLARTGYSEALKIVEQYSTKSRYRGVLASLPGVKAVEVKFPCNCSALTPRHRAYLDGRDMPTAAIEETYKIQGTGPIGDYKHRIVAPIYFEGQLVSYQGRDITGKSLIKYKACREAEEVVHHKHILYAWDLTEGDSCAIVEGVFDAWRLGPGAIATFGTGYTQEQFNIVSKRFRRVFLIFDPEPTAQAIAEKFAYGLEGIGVEAHIVELDGTDPGDMKQADANHLMRECKLKGWW